MSAAQVTLAISFWGVVLSLVLGLVCSIITDLRIPVLRQIVAVYVELSRGTPLLVQLFFLYFGFSKLGILVGMLIGVVELIRTGSQIIDLYRFQCADGALWVYGAIFLMYFAICFPLSLVQRHLERKADK